MDSIRSHTEDLINIIANPSIKINNTNQKELIRIIYAILDQAMLQINAINSLLGRLLEQRDMTNTLLNKRDRTQTYAEITKKPERKRSLSRKREDSVVALIYPKADVESEVTRDEVKKSINPIQLGMGIKRVKKIAKGGVLMGLNNDTDYNKLALDIDSNDNLRENYVIKKAEKLRPKIIVYTLQSELEDEEIINCLEAQNGILKESNCKLEFIMKSSRGKNAIIALESESFNQIIKKGKINIKWGRFNIREYIRPLQCYNCYKYGHLAKFCRAKKKCRNCCSDEHETDKCVSEMSCFKCYQYNVKFNTKHDCHHSVRDRNCLIYENEILKLRARIDYGSSN